MYIDSYAHISLKKYLPVDSLIEQMNGAGIERAVIVQPLGDEDHGHLKLALREYPEKFVAVGFVEVDSPAAIDVARAMVEVDRFAGVRTTSEAFKFPAFFAMLRSTGTAWMPHLPEGIGYHLSQIELTLENLPGLRVCIPHLGWPKNPSGPTHHWREAISEFSRYSNVAIVISALYYFSTQPFPHKDTWGWIEFVIKTMGIERCQLGSDFPLLLEAESYPDYFSFFRRDGPSIFAEQLEAFLGNAAAQFWKIPQ